MINQQKINHELYSLIDFFQEEISLESLLKKTLENRDLLKEGLSSEQVLFELGKRFQSKSIASEEYYKYAIAAFWYVLTDPVTASTLKAKSAHKIAILLYQQHKNEQYLLRKAALLKMAYYYFGRADDLGKFAATKNNLSKMKENVVEATLIDLGNLGRTINNSSITKISPLMAQYGFLQQAAKPSYDNSFTDENLSDIEKTLSSLQSFSKKDDWFIFIGRSFVYGAKALQFQPSSQKITCAWFSSKGLENIKIEDTCVSSYMEYLKHIGIDKASLLNAQNIWLIDIAEQARSLSFFYYILAKIANFDLHAMKKIHCVPIMDKMEEAENSKIQLVGTSVRPVYISHATFKCLANKHGKYESYALGHPFPAELWLDWRKYADKFMLVEPLSQVAQNRLQQIKEYFSNGRQNQNEEESSQELSNLNQFKAHGDR